VVKKAATFCYVKKTFYVKTTPYLLRYLANLINTGQERCVFNTNLPYIKATEVSFAFPRKPSSVSTSVGDPDPHVFGPPESGSISQRYGSGPGLRLKIMYRTCGLLIRNNIKKIIILHP
jgi:hypothetical protein